jgi:hypothetical protein
MWKEELTGINGKDWTKRGEKVGLMDVYLFCGTRNAVVTSLLLFSRFHSRLTKLQKVAEFHSVRWVLTESRLSDLIIS